MDDLFSQKELNSAMGRIDKEMEDAEQMTLEMDTVSDMLTRLASGDNEVSLAAQEEIDNYLKGKEHLKEQTKLQEDIIAGCKTVSEKTVFNNQASTLDRRKTLSNEYKSQVSNLFLFWNF